MTRFDDMKNEILTVLAERSDRQYTVTQLTSILSLKKDYQIEVQSILNSLHAEGKVIKYGKKYTFNAINDMLNEEYEVNETNPAPHSTPSSTLNTPNSKFLTGRFDATSLARNFSYAFVIMDDDNDVFVSTEDTLNAYHGDTVEVEVTRYRQGKRYGIIRKIIKREKDKFIGVLETVRGKTYFRSDSLKIHTLFEVVSEELGVRSEELGDAKQRKALLTLHSSLKTQSSLKVMVQIINWGLRQKSKLPICKVVEILGEAGNPEVEILSVIREFDLPMEFPEVVLQEAQEFTDEITQEELSHRKDLRGLYTLTIDPASAKDFDDAISLTEAENGDLHLYVHIADVAHFIKPDSALWTEAVNRGNSYYFPKKVIPMIPEMLSNKLCSLRPDEDKYTISQLTVFSPTGKIKEQTIFESIIRSDIRLAYEEVDEYFESSVLSVESGALSDKKARSARSLKTQSSTLQTSLNPQPSKLNPLYAALDIMRKLSKLLSLSRVQRGYLKFDLPEVEYIYDDEGYIKDIVRTKETESHILIENFMLIANEYVAKLLTKKTKTTMYRIHEEPDETDLQRIKDMLKAHKIRFNMDENLNKTWQNILDSLPDERYHRVFDKLILRSMKKAKYSVNHLGHFGLGLQTYTHFTSPIRRLCDLVVHTQLKSVFGIRGSGFGDATQINDVDLRHERKNQTPKTENRKPKTDIFELAGIATEREQIADDSERMMEQKVIATFMQRHIGKTYKAIITNLNPHTIFIELDDIPVRGVIKLKQLTDDFYEFDQHTYQTKGKRKGKIYKLCDEIDVVLTNVSDDIYFTFVGMKADEEGRKSKNENRKFGSRRRRNR